MEFSNKGVRRTEKMKLKRPGLLSQIIIAIVLGIGAGIISPALPVRIFVTFNGLFSEFLAFIIPLIIVGLVAPAIADIGKGAGKMLAVTALLAYGATLFSGFTSYAVGETFFPMLITRDIPLSEISEANGVVPFFTIDIPEPMNVMTALVMAFTLGLGMANLNTSYLKNAFVDFKDIIVKTIQKVILPLLPIYIFVCDSRTDSRQKPFQDACEHDAGLFHCTGYAVICRHHTGNAETNSKERSERRYRRIRDTSVCHDTSVGKYDEDCGMCPCSDDDARHTLRLQDDVGIHIHVGNNHGCSSGCTRWSYYGIIGNTVINAWIR